MKPFKDTFSPPGKGKIRVNQLRPEISGLREGIGEFLPPGKDIMACPVRNSILLGGGRDHD
jgi:hypothetical protein